MGKREKGGTRKGSVNFLGGNEGEAKDPPEVAIEGSLSPPHDPRTPPPTNRQKGYIQMKENWPKSTP